MEISLDKLKFYYVIEILIYKKNLILNAFLEIQSCFPGCTRISESPTIK